jgi:1-acyl-sn-glycerol-3-phosphate acyltransferase
MSKRDKIEKWSLGYQVLRASIRLAFNIFYRDLQIKGRENIPAGSPVIFAPNHQNSLMDALAVLLNIKKQPVFLARSDIFKKGAITVILTFLKIMPIYRMRDGFGTLGKNQEIFEHTKRILENRKSVGLMPEGNHGDKHKLRPFVKGLFRIAFMGQEKFGNQPGVKIVPVGLDYSDYPTFRSALLIRYAKPMEVADFFDEYQENQAAGIKKCRDELSERLSDEIIDIRNTRYYQSFDHLRRLYQIPMLKRLGIEGRTLNDRFIAGKKTINYLEREAEINEKNVEELDNLTSTYVTLSRKFNFNPGIFEKKKYNWFLLIVKSLLLLATLPVLLYGFITNILPVKVTEKSTTILKDKQFVSSVKLVGGFLIFLLYYIILFIIAAIIVPGFLYPFLFFISLPVIGFLALKHYEKFVDTIREMKYNYLTSRNRNSFVQLKATINLIIQKIDAIIDRQDKENKE